MQAPEAPDSGASLSHTQMCPQPVGVGLSGVESMVPAVCGLGNIPGEQVGG